MHGGVVVVFDPVSELLVEHVDRGEVEIADQKLITDSAKEAFDLPFSRSVTDGGVAKDAAHTGTDQRNLLAAVDRTVVNV